VHILEFDGGIIGHRACIIARPKQKEEGDHYHVCDCNLTICRSVTERLCLDKDYNYYWDRLHSTWSGIFFLVCLDMMLYPKVYATMCIFARVRGPQYGMCLANSADAVLQCPSSNGFLTVSQPSILVSFTKDLEQGYRF
jgi:hypothetical protein